MDETRIPKLVEDVDLTTLPMDSFDGFVLSRVDGLLTLEDLSDATGVSLERVTRVLEKLAGLGAVTWGTPAPPRPSRLPPRRLGTATSTPARRAPSTPPRAVGAGRRDPGRPRRPSGPTTPVELDIPTAFDLPSLDYDAAMPSEVGAREAPRPTSRRPSDADSPSVSESLPEADVDTTLDVPPPDSPVDSWPPLAETVPLAESAPAPAADADAEPEERFAAPPPKPQGPSSSSHATAEDEDLDLDPARRRQIQDLYDRLEDLDHYAVLDVPRSAEKKAIRDAYFRLSKQFHPDTLFGKKIGSYRFKMERVFLRLTEAYEVLGKKKRRGPYDEYLALKDRTAAIQSGLAQGAVVAERVATASRPPADGAGAWEEADAPEDVDASTDGPLPGSEAPGSGSTPSVDPGVRRRVARDLLERRLRGATGHRRRSSDDIEAPATSKDQVLRRLTNSLRDAAKLTGGTSRYDAYVRAGDAAMEKDDLVTAVNSFRLALAMQSEPDAEVQERYESLRLRLATQMAESYERQGRYEEQSGRWRDAARSWLKVVDGRPGEVKPLRRAAAAFLKGDGDLRQARDLAKRAVELSPDDVAGHVLLARIFYAAGMTASAIQQLQTAAKLDPTNKTVKNLLAEMK